MRSQRGQATTETIMLTWIVLIFFAAIYQFHLMNQTIYRSITAVHGKLFEAAMAHNCADEDNEDCEHNTDQNAKVIWNPTDIPEVRVPVVNIFQQWGLGADGTPRLYSLRVDPDEVDMAAEAAKGCVGTRCKRTKAGAGTVIGHFEVIGEAFEGILGAGEAVPEIDTSFDIGSMLTDLITSALDVFSF